MSELKYTVIKDDAQYFEYCDKLWELCQQEGESKQIDDEIDLLTLLIDKYDDEHVTFDKGPEPDPVEFLMSMMSEHKWKAKDLAEYLNVSRGLVSDILNYKKGMSKEIIRKLAERFKMRQEAFNRPYPLVGITTPKRKIGTVRKRTVKTKAKRKLHEL